MSKTKKVPDFIDVRECYKKVRKTWEINPRTRVKDSAKKYKRAKAKQDWRKEEEI